MNGREHFASAVIAAVLLYVTPSHGINGVEVEVWCPPVARIWADGAWVTFRVAGERLVGGGGYLPRSVLRPESGWKWRRK
jgi:hypothetical protein